MRIVFYSLFSLFSSTQIFADNSFVNVSVGIDTLAQIKKEFPKDVAVLKKSSKTALVRIPSSELPHLSHMMHEVFNRCGGYIVESDNLQEAVENLDGDLSSSVFESQVLHNQDLVKKATALVSESNIRTTIKNLSQFRNRFYTSNTGIQSQEWIGTKWKELASRFANTDLQYFEHNDYPQRSVIFTIKGTSKANEIIVVGGHGDSIAGWDPSDEVDAPGADDNASGIATLTEALRILAILGKEPIRTIKFMSYAAEEVGLRGSQDIAAAFKQRQEHVVGVMQLDMTNYTQRKNEIVLMTDYTDRGQNAFIKDLIHNYIPHMIAVEDRCGYACSDHASWSRKGYPASIPFESRMDEHNSAIHSRRDTLERTQNNAEHSVPYAQLLVAYLLELGY